MIRRALLITVFAILGYGFWYSTNLKDIAAGVAIFLFGMLFLEEGFRAFSGGALERILKVTTDKFWKSLGFGIVTTTLMQSSSLVSVITISFLSAGLIGLASGIGIIFGANIGTTTGAWLVAGIGLKVKISAYAMPMLVFGVILHFQASKVMKGLGSILAGLGFLFLGIHFMKEGFEAFRETIDLAKFAVPGLLGLVVYTLLGMAATVIMQSSHATLVLILTALAAAQITYENALALAIGANIGTTVTAVIGSLSANYQGKRLAGAHLVFNVATGIIALVFINQFLYVVEGISGFVGIPHDDYSLKLAVFHTVFNLVGVAIMTPFVSKLVTGLERVIPAPVQHISVPRYLSDSTLQLPDTMLEALRKELVHLYDNSLEVIAHGLNLHRSQLFATGSISDIVNADRTVIEFDFEQTYDTRIKSLYGEILAYSIRADKSLSAQDAKTLHQLSHAARCLVRAVKNVKHLRKNLSDYSRHSNQAIRDEYNGFRIEIARLLRLIQEIRQDEPDDRDVLELDAFKMMAEENDIVISGELDRLIRNDLITPEMGSSLINDRHYAKSVVWNLTEFGQSVFGPHDHIAKEAEAMISLNEDDVEELEHQRKIEAAADPDKIA